jgi:hypothetical protein
MLETVTRGALSLEDDAAAEVRGFVASRRCADGGFMGRDRQSDLYYTVFGAACLRALSPDSSLESLAGYLDGFGDGRDLDFVHLSCLLRCLVLANACPLARQESVLSRLEGYRARDRGYNHASRQADCGSAYAAFLALLSYRAVGRTPPDVEGILASLGGLRSGDGGYANKPGADRGSTTAAAAAATVRICLGEPVPDGVDRWLLAQAHERGGFRATPAAPAPDLLSTATALFALKAMRTDLRGLTEATADYVALLWDYSGGFVGHVFDSNPDCEYTFYALLALGSLEP